jgi:squalene-hopene/tetraprenyl-beta-curcumene cyclase
MTVQRLLFAILYAGLVVTVAAAEDARPELKLTPNLATEPIATKLSLKKAAEFLDNSSLAWTRQRKCGTCHTNYPYLMARVHLKEGSPDAVNEVRKFFEGRVANWDGDDKTAKPRWDTEVVATAAALAINDAMTTGKLHPLTRTALDRAWTLQQKDGSWSWLKCDWPPMEHDDYYGAVFAALGVGYAPDGYAKSEAAKDGLEKLRGYLRKTPPPDLHHKAMLLWASVRLDGLMSDAEKKATVKELRAKQRPDGGWNLTSLGAWKRRDGTANDHTDSDGYATGLAVVVLREAGVPADDEQLQRAVKWLKSNQRESGRWFTKSLNTDKLHYITHAGTSFAVLALKACDALDR